MREYKDCLACGHSTSEKSSNNNEDDILYFEKEVCKRS